MQLSCPACAACFEIDPAALGAKGRKVRCSACRTQWFAAAPALAGAPELSVSAADRAMPAITAPLTRVEAQNWEDAELVEVESPPVAMVAADDAHTHRPVRPKRSEPVRARAKRSGNAQALVLLACALAGVLMIGIAARESMVRAMPETASLYAAIGFPVNLRGLEFRNVRVVREMQDGVAVLLIDGEVENIAGRTVELPRLRFSITGQNGGELYAWTALLPRSTLYSRERAQFKSRLAAPPPDGAEVTVRFLTRADLSAGIR
jgi:predicted Zn finger-like uncharacterized protein